MISQKNLNNIHIGIQISPTDPFWVQVNETVRQHLNNRLVSFDIPNHGADLTDIQIEALTEEILMNELDAFICMILPIPMLQRLLEHGLPVICLESEIDLTHPLFTSIAGWYEAGKIIAQYLVESMSGRGRLLCLVGNSGESDRIDFNKDRLNGIYSIVDKYPSIELQIVQSYWDYHRAYEQLSDLISKHKITVPDAILGLSDSLALAMRHAGDATGFIGKHTRVGAINGEPSALSEIVKGRFHATVNIPPEEFAGQAVDLAIRVTQGEQMPPHFHFTPKLVTIKNVAEISVTKLDAISSIPSQLVGINRETEKHRILQYEITALINQNMAALTDKNELISLITELIRANYGFDTVFFYSVTEEGSVFVLENLSTASIIRVNHDETGTMFAEVLAKQEAMFVVDARFSSRFPDDLILEETRSRAVLPLFFGKRLLGILDLWSKSPRMRLRNELPSLQLLANQFGIAIHNAELYDEAVQAKSLAETANQLKTRLLANVSHELRAPMNIILGYCQAILTNPDLYNVQMPQELTRDITHIFHSGEHLIRLINDLLDVSRAEIGALEFIMEPVSPINLLRDVFYAMAEEYHDQRPIEWQLQLPDKLPVIQADAVRLRQIIINLLSNAHKFTESGSITLGALVEPPHIHIWVADTGCGISSEQQDTIFEPFITGGASSGIGLGLNITQQLVRLHGGNLSYESKLNEGSVFHIRLPLPTLSEQIDPTKSFDITHNVMLIVSTDATVRPYIQEICKQQQLQVYPIPLNSDLDAILGEMQPACIVWDVTDFPSSEWSQIKRIREHPRLNKLPFMVYRDDESQNATTNIFTKPVSNKSFFDYLSSLRPQSGIGQVLLVDDDAKTRQMYRNMIINNFADAEVLEAKDGNEAMRLLDQTTPSLILLDLMMPEVDGFKVLENIRNREATRHIPVIIISGKVLTFEDVKKLDYSNVILHRKGLLTPEEGLKSLKKVFSEMDFLPQPTSILVKQALAYLQLNYAYSISRQDVADAVGTDESYLSRIFRHEVGMTLWEFLTRLRVHYASEMLLKNESKSVAEVAFLVGYNDPAYFCKVFKRYTQLSPVAYRKQKR